MYYFSTLYSRQTKCKIRIIKTKLTFITFSILETIRTFATISKEGVTNLVIVAMITASELTVLSIFSMATKYSYIYIMQCKEQ